VRRAARDDRGSLAFAMLVTLVGFALAAILAPMALTQITSTREDNRRLTDLSAAQTGLDIALGHIQAANDGTGNGVLATLPCGPFTGTLSTATTANYNVTITYYQNDPRGHENDPTWQAANPPITCINGGGARVTPKYALLRSLGTDQTTTDITKTPNRGLTATYAFHITNQNIPGGNIRVYKLPTSKDLCLDAGSSSPLAGTNVQMQPCVEGRGQQKWAYNQDLTITLVGSGMCLEAGSPEAKGNARRATRWACASTAGRPRWPARPSSFRCACRRMPTSRSGASTTPASSRAPRTAGRATGSASTRRPRRRRAASWCWAAWTRVPAAPTGPRKRRRVPARPARPPASW